MFCTHPACPDVRRSGSSGEYRDGVEVCPKCGAALVRERPPSTSAETPRDDRASVATYEAFVPVMTIDDATLIPVVKSVLQSVGIRHFVRNEGTQDLLGYMRFSPGGYNPLLGVPELMVEPDRASEARDLLAEIERAGG